MAVFLSAGPESVTLGIGVNQGPTSPHRVDPERKWCLWAESRYFRSSVPVWRSASYTTIAAALARLRLRTPGSKIGIQ